MYHKGESWNKSTPQKPEKIQGQYPQSDQPKTWQVNNKHSAHPQKIHDRLARVLLHSRHEKQYAGHIWMDKTAHTSNLLETVEENTSQTRESCETGNWWKSGMAMGKQQTRILENSWQLDTQQVINKQIPRITRIWRHIQQIRGKALKLPNRRIPNGTYGGVRGRLLK